MTMGETFSFFLTAFVSLFAIVDAIGNATIFLSITPNHTPSERASLATKASIAVFFILTVFALLGHRIFDFFGITIDAFRIAGGLILLKISMDMLEVKLTRTRHTPEEERESMGREDIAIIPLAMPMLSGPGAISTVVVLAGQADTLERLGLLELAIFLNAVVVFLVLRSSAGIVIFMRETGLRLFTRILGIVLASIAIQFIVTGIQNAFSLSP
jgi:multiple antibiotic resistance protein